MKTILKTFVATVVACALVSCNKEAVAPDNNGEYVKVSFLADAQDVSTKATLTPNDEDAVFSSAWEAEDKLSVEYMSFAGEGSSGVVDAVWNGTSFDAVINDGSKGEWSYDAIFPAPQVSSIDKARFIDLARQEHRKAIVTTASMISWRAAPFFLQMRKLEKLTMGNQ